MNATEVLTAALVLVTIFASSFFAFTLSLRQFNHFCIMIGAMDHTRPATPEEIEAAPDPGPPAH